MILSLFPSLYAMMNPENDDNGASGVTHTHPTRQPDTSPKHVASEAISQNEGNSDVVAVVTDVPAAKQEGHVTRAVQEINLPVNHTNFTRRLIQILETPLDVPIPPLSAGMEKVSVQRSPSKEAFYFMVPRRSCKPMPSSCS